MLDVITRDGISNMKIDFTMHGPACSVWSVFTCCSLHTQYHYKFSSAYISNVTLSNHFKYVQCLYLKLFYNSAGTDRKYFDGFLAPSRAPHGTMLYGGIMDIGSWLLGKDTVGTYTDTNTHLQAESIHYV